MEFNQFQKELRDRGIEGQTAYMMTLMYERIIDLSQQVVMASRLIDELATSLGNFVELHENTQRQLKTLMRHGRPDGVEVHSVAYDPDESEH
jgi:predicted HTH domain antitoxin